MSIKRLCNYVYYCYRVLFTTLPTRGLQSYTIELYSTRGINIVLRNVGIKIIIRNLHNVVHYFIFVRFTIITPLCKHGKGVQRKASLSGVGVYLFTHVRAQPRVNGLSQIHLSG